MPFLQKYNESAPPGIHLQDFTVRYNDYPTPNINDFRKEAIIFPRSYVGGPKCAPSRFSLLTGRMPSRSLWAIKSTLENGAGAGGTTIIVQTNKLWGDDTIYNLPTVLQDNGYYTGTVGKWHLLSGDDNGYNLGCVSLQTAPNATLYEKCTEIVKEGGFDFVDGWYAMSVSSRFCMELEPLIPPEFHSENDQNVKFNNLILYRFRWKIRWSLPFSSRVPILLQVLFESGRGYQS